MSRDLEEAARYFKRAAVQGNALGQVNYGVCLWEGNGVPQNMDKAEEYLKKAVDQGNGAGQYYYALFLEKNDRGQELDDAIREQIAHYYKLSADQKFPEGENAYGQCLETGFGVKRDLEKAAEYYLRASENGDMNGQYHYARFLVSGKGDVKKDLPKAVELLMKAVKSGHHDAALLLEQVQKSRPELIPRESKSLASSDVTKK